jgi:microcystin-dependent protein
MSSPYVGEIRLVGFNFAPAGWMLCQGQLLAISEYSTLFNLIGTYYGGDGQTTFGLPDLRGRAAIHAGTLSGGPTYVLGQIAGTETVTLTTQQIPAHSHTIGANSATGTVSTPGGNTFAAGALNQYQTTAPSTTAPMLASMGGSQPHDNLMPYLTASYVISLYGVYPSQS